MHGCRSQILADQLMLFKTGGRHFVDIIGDISWTKGVTSRGHFWRHLVDKNVHEMSSFWVTFRGHFLGDISWTFFLLNPCGHLSSNKLTQIQTNPNPTQPKPNLT